VICGFSGPINAMLLRMNGRFAPTAVRRRLIGFSVKPYQPARRRPHFALRQPAEFAKPPIIDQMLRIWDTRWAPE